MDGRQALLCAHRKGATRALAPGDPALPGAYRDVGQPAPVPGSMGTLSYVLVGELGGEASHSTCHSAGRAMSRKRAMKGQSGRELTRWLEDWGIRLVAALWRGCHTSRKSPF